MISIPKRCRYAFTLIELLVVIAIIAVLIALLIPAVQRVREAASRSKCINNLKQLALAVHSYHDAKKRLPPSRLHVGSHEFASWAVIILPYIEQQNLYKEWDLRLKFSAQSAVARETEVPQYFCPSRRKPGKALSTLDAQPGAYGDYAICGGDRIN